MSGPTDYLAAERTFLAWIRTGLALMGFGFVVARFGLYLEQTSTRSYGLSVPLGIVLIGIGIVTNVGSMANYFQVVKDLRDGRTEFERPSRLGFAIAGLLAVLGLAMVIGLMLVARDGKGQMQMASNSGLVSVPSTRSVDQTVDTIQGILKTKGIKLFALVDHSGEAKAAGLEMRPTKLLIFGNPKGGTPLMIASPSVAIDLPMKLLVSEDANGKVWITYNAPAYLQARHNLPQELVGVLGAVEGIAKAAE